ncbi:MAG: hypothetical protein NPIRA04_04640 [Nitrospirales bacterium]|nr:MAG: hypothetical protein NPIRA04_04640 [Nitrospirales bacterium]
MEKETDYKEGFRKTQTAEIALRMIIFLVTNCDSAQLVVVVERVQIEDRVGQQSANLSPTQIDLHRENDTAYLDRTTRLTWLQ